MKSRISAFIFIVLFCFSTEALNCSSNPCALDGYFAVTRGYQCVQINAVAICTCPKTRFEIDRPCRVCNRTNPNDNPCVPSSNLLACLETDEYGATSACLCLGPTGPVITLSSSCESTVIETTTTTTTTTAVPVTTPVCNNGGNIVDGACHCPSGFGGTLCEQKFDAQLCERIVCQNEGVCAIRNPNGPYESICFCGYGISGDYCQLKGTLGFCTSGLCLNGASCRENVIGVTRHAYCECLPGYNGMKCETQYFKCTTNGRFVDTFMNEQGKYFECTQTSGSYRLEQKLCAKGLRFNPTKNTCAYP